MKGLYVNHYLIALGLVLAAPAWATPKTATLDVPGMSCATCPITVNKALSRLAGVIEVKSHLGKRETTVVFDDARISLSELTTATREAGFPSTVKGMPR